MAAKATTRSRREFVLAGAAMSAAGLMRGGAEAVMAQDEAPATPETGSLERKMEVRQALLDLGFHWSATSPATRLDDVFTITLTNHGADPLELWVSTIIMDHKAHHNEAVIDERFELAPHAERALSATNAYGQANHFSTRMIAATGDPTTLAIQASIVDASGVETTTFNERAFWIKSAGEMGDGGHH